MNNVEADIGMINFEREHDREIKTLKFLLLAPVSDLSVMVPEK